MLTGRLIAGSVTLPSGEYRLDALPPGNYRLIGQSLDGPIGAADIAPAGGSYAGLMETKPSFRSFIFGGRSASQSISITADVASSLGQFVSLNSPATLKPQLIGMNGELSTAALPLEAGKKFTIYVGGEGLDQIAADGISISSPFIKVDAATLAEAQFDTPFPVISFEVTIAPNALPGDYSIRLQSISGELAYLPGALTIDPK